MKKVPTFALSGVLSLSLTFWAPTMALAQDSWVEIESAELALEASAPAFCDSRGDALSMLPSQTDVLSSAILGNAGSNGDASLLATEDFPDCVAGEWYDEAIDYVTDRGIIKGYDNGLFGPYDSVTRGQLATILWRLAGEPQVSSGGFPDLNGNDYFYSAALWAQRTGIISGREINGARWFDGNSPVLRQEAVTMLAKYAELCGCDISSDCSKAAQISGWHLADEWALPYFGWAVDKGLVSGVVGDDGVAVLDAKGGTVRSAMAKMVMVLDSQVTKGSQPDAPEEPSTETQAQREQRVLGYFQSTLDQQGLSSKGWTVMISDEDETTSIGHSYILFQPIDMTMNEIRFGYRYSAEIRQTMYELTDSIDDLSASMYAVSVQEGANLPVVCAMMSSDGQVVYAAKNGSTLIPLSYTM